MKIIIEYLNNRRIRRKGEENGNAAKVNGIDVHTDIV